MAVTIVNGLSWGDEGKGKIVDLEAKSADVIIRFSGGNNAGHSIKNEYGEFALHLVPAGIFNPDAINIIERGVVIHLPSLMGEMQELLRNPDVSFQKFKISPFAHLVMPWHIAEDQGYEKEAAQNIAGRATEAIGTTLKGIGPCYKDKAGRWEAFRVCDLVSKKAFLARLEKVYASKAKWLRARFQVELPSFDAVRTQFLGAREYVLPYIADTSHIIQEALAADKSILLEGAQGTLLDPDHGTYPNVTSSPTTALGALMITGIPSSAVRRVIGVTKAYVTRVGAGAFPTELSHELDEKLRNIGKEFGATTGRPRRCGWLDLPLLQYAVAINGTTEIALTKMDVLGQLPKVQLGTSYENGVSGAPDMTRLSEMKPAYEEFAGWGNLAGARTRADLPDEARRYLERITAICSIGHVSIGAGRTETLTM